jgi:chemotaxis-related protein WspD
VSDTLGTGIFERPMPPGYRDELQALMAERPEDTSRATSSLLLFRVGTLNLAIATRTASAIAPVLHVARIPHRSGTVLLGLAAFRGQILPCCSLARLLNTERLPCSHSRTLILEESPGRRWAIPIDAVVGVQLAEVLPLSPNTASAAPWSNGEIHHHDGTYTVLDQEVLFRQIMLATA